MHAGSSHSAGSSNSNASVQATYAPGLQAFVFVLFFAFGGITSLNDVLIPKLRGLFTLSYGEVMLIQFAFFAAYFIISIPAAALVRPATEQDLGPLGARVSRNSTVADAAETKLFARARAISSKSTCSH